MYKDVVFHSQEALLKMDTFDANSAEDASSSPGPGGTRRAGNLWTAEARDDMYRRRENGESWEDICKVIHSTIYFCFSLVVLCIVVGRYACSFWPARDGLGLVNSVQHSRSHIRSNARRLPA